MLQKAFKETFALYDVPKEALNLGLAGVLPYLATSVSTLYLAWDINHASLTGEGFLVSGPTAEALLHVIEPLQIGYGAVVSVTFDMLKKAEHPRSYHFSVLFTGVLSGLNTEAKSVTGAMLMGSSRQRSHGLRSFSLWNTPSSLSSALSPSCTSQTQKPSKTDGHPPGTPHTDSSLPS